MCVYIYTVRNVSISLHFIYIRACVCVCMYIYRKFLILLFVNICNVIFGSGWLGRFYILFSLQ